MAAITRDRLVAYLDEFLDTAAFADKSPNGLQVQGTARVEKVAFAVDASLDTIRAAMRTGAQMLIVHHGLWWGQHEQIVGNLHKRMSALIKNDVSLYASHLPLDCHAEVGNNAELARLLGLKREAAFGQYLGTAIGLVTVAHPALTRSTLVTRITRTLDVKPDVLAFGPNRVRRVGIISGAGGRAAEEAKLAGCDTLFTGETDHAAFHPAKEAGINMIFAGHYATETVGLSALERHLRAQFNVRTKFIHAPTGF